MATLKCLACGHDNHVGDESCTSCSSSLNLKLCSACEAINANSAERCHSCNAEFRVEAEVASPVQPELAIDEAPAPFPATWLLAAQEASRRGRRVTRALWLVPLLAAGLAYYFYAAFQAPKEALRPASAAQITQPPAPVPVAPASVVKPAPAPVARPAPASEPKRTTAAITHTRAPTAGEPLKTTTAAVPAVSAAVPAVSTAVPAVRQPAQAMVERKRPHVTHTRAAVAEAEAGAGSASLVPAAAGASAPEKRIEESTGCEPSVAALGLCKAK